MRSALYIGSKQNNPLTRTKIPSCASPNGMPFCFEYSGEVTQWQLVKDGEEYGYDLDVSWLTNDGKYIYYNGDVDLLEYLTGLGYDARAGRYYYSFRLDGAVNKVNLTGIDSSNSMNYDSTQAYGVWDFDINFLAAKTFNIDYILGVGGVYTIYVAATYFDIYEGGNNIFGVSSSLLSTDQRFKLTIKRNQTLNQYFTGAADSMAFYVNDVIIDDTGAWAGSNPLIRSVVTTSESVKFVCGDGITLYNSPAPYTVETGGFNEEQVSSSGGTIKQSNLFQLECEDTRPITPGDFNNDFSNDFF